MRDIHRCFILWNLLQSQGNALKVIFLTFLILLKYFSDLSDWNVHKESKGVQKPSPGKLFQEGHFIQKAIYKRSQAFLCSSTKVQPHKITLAPSYLRISVQIFPLSGTRLFKNLHMTLFSHYLDQRRNADSSEKPSLTTLYIAAPPSNPIDYCCSLTFLKGLIV